MISKAGNAAKKSFVFIHASQTSEDALRSLIDQKRLVGVIINQKGEPIGVTDRRRLSAEGKRTKSVEDFETPQYFIDSDTDLVTANENIQEILRQHPDLPAVVIESNGVVKGILSRRSLSHIESQARLSGVEGSGLGGDPVQPAKVFSCPLGHERRVYDSTYGGKAPRCRRCGRTMRKGF